MASINQVSQLFVALYNRAIDGGTAQTYAGRAYNQGLISDILGLAPNMRTMTNQEFVELVYKNALGKDNNSDKAGIDHWVNAANENNWRREELTDNLLKSINAWADQNVSPNTLLGNTDDIESLIALASNGATVFKTKVAISEKAATTIGGNADVYSLTFGSGLEDVTIGNYNTTQENNNKILQGIAARNPLAQSGGNTLTLDANGQTTFLPTDPNPPASGASKYVASTKFDDVIIGTVTAATDVDNPSSFTSETKIDAGEGYDTLKLNMSADFIRDAALGGSVTGIEKIELTNTTVNDNVTFNASGIRDVYTYVLNGSNGINLTNIAYNEYLLIEMNNVKSTGNTTTSSGANTVTNGGVTQITFDTTPTGGRLDLNFNNVGYDSTDNKISNHDILFGIGSGTAINPGASADDFANQAAGIGMLNIALSGSNYVDIVNNGVNRITVGGNGSLTTNLSQGVTYFNGANATGKLNVTALAPKETGENGTNIFEYFATGSADDTVNIAVERLGQNATIDLGGGSDTLILSGQVDHEARKQFYNLNTVENLVFGALSGDALLIDLGTTTTTTTETITSGSGSKTTEETITNTTVTADRSANLQTITFEDGASVQLTGLGFYDSSNPHATHNKALKIIYNGATENQHVLVDADGEINLILQGNDNGIAGSKQEGAGSINLAQAKILNLDLTGQGFAGYLSASNATELHINNLTGDKKLTLKPNTLTARNDLSAVETITINTQAQDQTNQATASGLMVSVDLSSANLSSLSKATLNGIGGIVFGDINQTSTQAGINLDGSGFSGFLETGNLYVRDQALSITTKGALTTGNLAASHINIDLSKSIANSYENNIGTIILTPNLKGEVATLNYITGIHGTRGNNGDAQTIKVQAQRANITLDGLGGMDQFIIEASSFTKEIILQGHLGSSANQSDSVSIDLRKTNGAIIDFQNLIVNNNNQGIAITASKGQDNITLVANTNHDIISFNAGGPATAQAEKYSLNLANTTLEKFQSFSLEGLTLTSLYVDGTISSAELTNALYTYITQGEQAFKATKSTIQKPNTTDTYTYNELFITEGSFTGLNNKQGWENNPQLITKTNDTTIQFTSSEDSNVPDLKLAWSGNEKDSQASFEHYFDQQNSYKQAASVAPIAAKIDGVFTQTKFNNFIDDSIEGTASTIQGQRFNYRTERDPVTGETIYYYYSGELYNYLARIYNSNSTSPIIASFSATTLDGVTYTLSIEKGENPNTGVQYTSGYIYTGQFETAVVQFLNGQKITGANYGDYFRYYTSRYKDPNDPSQGVTYYWETSTYSSGGSTYYYYNTPANPQYALGVNTKVKIYKTEDDGTKTDVTDTWTNPDLLEGVTVSRVGYNSYSAYMNKTSYLNLKLDSNTQNISGSFSLNGQEIDLAAYVPRVPPKAAKITVTFEEGLAIGESYKFAGKYVFAREALSAEDVAKAFKGDSVSGAIVLGDWYQELDSNGNMTIGIDEANVNFSVTDSTLTLEDKQPNTAQLNAGIPLGIKGMETDTEFMNALQVTGGASTLKVELRDSTKQGQDAEDIRADSYINLSILHKGDETSPTEFVKSVEELGTLSSISNFEVGVDKLALHQFADDVQIEYQGELFNHTNLATQSDLNISDTLYVDEMGSTLSASINQQGIIAFNTEASLEHKLYLLKHLAPNKLAGFAHHEDFYVLASGNNPNATTDDLVIELNGIAQNVVELSTLLA